MKPDEELSQEMDEEPESLFVELGMLVVDGRQPELSVKGRIEGPHCMKSAAYSDHVCKSSDGKCVEASKFRSEMHQLWTNCIPMCIEVSMCQLCEVDKGQHDCDEAMGVLLERWTISVLACRWAEMYMTGQGLQQAVRSYLYFSQLSAWLNSSQGTEPRKIIYRVSAPGESYLTPFSQKPDEHVFPVARACKLTGIQVTVAALPRCGTSPQMVSRTLIQSLSPPKQKYFKSSPDGAVHGKAVSTESTKNGSLLKDEVDLCFSSKVCKFYKGSDTSQWSKLGDSSSVCSIHVAESLNQNTCGAIPKSSSKPSKDRLSLPVHSGKCGYQTLESPKVLFTSVPLSNSQTTYDNDCFSLAENLTDLESALSSLSLSSNSKQCKPVGKTDLSMKELNLLPEESRVKFSIGHSPITLSPHGHAIELRNVSRGGERTDMKAIRQLDFNKEQEPPQASVEVRSMTYCAKSDLACLENDNCQNGTTSYRKFETPSTSLLFTKKLSKLSKNLEGHFVPPGHQSLEENLSEGVDGNCTKSKSLLSTLMKKEALYTSAMVSSKPIPTAEDKAMFRRSLDGSTSLLFNSQTGLPTQSSPAPVKKKSANGQFGYDCTLNNIKAIKKVISCSKLDLDKQERTRELHYLSTSAPASTNCLLGNFEESLLNGRLEPAGVLDGFTAEIGASGSFCPKHVQLPVTTYFFSLSDDNAPSPYLGHINLSGRGKRGYHVPKKGTVQVTLFNPEGAVVKMFVVMYDLTDMPPNCQTFLRQRTFYMPVLRSSHEAMNLPTYLRYLIHLRYSSTKSGKIYLHTDIRLIFSRDKFEFDSRIATYELRSFTERPENPRYSPKR